MNVRGILILLEGMLMLSEQILKFSMKAMVVIDVIWSICGGKLYWALEHCLVY